MDTNLLQLSNPVFAGYAFYSAILIFKMMLVGYLTGYQRLRKKACYLSSFKVFGTRKPPLFDKGLKLVSTVSPQLYIAIEIGISLYHFILKKAFVNSEDAAQFGVDIKPDDSDVERVRRAHRNDLENIPIFLISSLIFVTTNPNVTFALILFRLYTIFRITHTVVYCVTVVNMPTRTISFALGVLINLIIVFAIIIASPQF